MRLSVKIKLFPTPEQKAMLLRTIEAANAASNHASQVAFDAMEFGRTFVHERCYDYLRDEFGLPSQTAVRCIARVVDAYKTQRSLNRAVGRKELTVCRFGRRAAVAFDDRNLRWKTGEGMVGITTVDGRTDMPFRCSPDQARLLNSRAGESDLSTFNGEWYLTAVCEVEAKPPVSPRDVLGVDLGIVNIAVDSDGNVWSGKAVNTARSRFRRMRRKLQKKGTRSAKRLLRKRAKREARFATDVNHCISKHLVSSAEGTHRAIALEDLGGIRRRVTVSRQQRARHGSWAFAQLQAFVGYKAQMRGVAVILVDPRDTSRTCPVCGHVSKSNRPTRDSFRCQSCGFSGPADSVAATIIADRGRAAVNLPNATRAANAAPSCKLSPSGDSR